MKFSSRPLPWPAVIWLSAFLVVLPRAVASFDPGSLRDAEEKRVLSQAAACLQAAPRTVVHDPSPRSGGGPHDFHSEGDYWWPDPENPEGPFLRRDGESYPGAFNRHRESLMRLSRIVATLTSAYLVSGDEIHARAAGAHLRAWFIDPTTRMHPRLEYAQAVHGRHSGRSIGIIDTLHLIEVARSARLLAGSEAYAPGEEAAVKAWFGTYLHWLNTHPYGRQEQVHPNNHGVCWSLQAAVFADLVGDAAQLEWVRSRFKQVYLGEMMAADGSFPAELARTKPYGYSLFILDALCALAEVASTPEDDLWAYRREDGLGLPAAVAFMYPFIDDKGSWPLPPDVQNWEAWPVRHSALLFAGRRLDQPAYLELWGRLESDPEGFETRRNFPLRHPLLWVDL